MSDITFTGPDSLSEPISHRSMYSDGTPMVKTPGWARIVSKANAVTVKAESLASFVDAMFLVDAVHFAGGSIDKLVLPYIPGARQDRTNPAGDVLFTARSVANMINQRGFDSVVVLDPHSHVVTDYLRNVVEYPLDKVARMVNRIETFDGVIAPDKGAAERAKIFADDFDLPLIQGFKVRDVSTGKLSGFDVDVEAHMHYLVADDICDGGGTFLGLGDKIAEQDATASLFVSHGIFSKGTVELRKHYNDLYTTDSFAHNIEDASITTLGVVKDMENYNG